MTNAIGPRRQAVLDSIVTRCGSEAAAISLYNRLQLDPLPPPNSGTVELVDGRTVELLSSEAAEWRLGVREDILAADERRANTQPQAPAE